MVKEESARITQTGLVQMVSGYVAICLALDGLCLSFVHVCRSLSGNERLNYYQKRLGGDEGDGERVGLGFGGRNRDEGSHFNEERALRQVKQLAQGGEDVVQAIMQHAGICALAVCMMVLSVGCHGRLS